MSISLNLKKVIACNEMKNVYIKMSVFLVFGNIQIKDTPNSYLTVDNTEIGHRNRIPLWMFRLLY